MTYLFLKVCLVTGMSGFSRRCAAKLMAPARSLPGLIINGFVRPRKLKAALGQKKRLGGRKKEDVKSVTGGGTPSLFTTHDYFCSCGASYMCRAGRPNQTRSRPVPYGRITPLSCECARVRIYAAGRYSAPHAFGPGQRRIARYSRHIHHSLRGQQHG